MKKADREWLDRVAELGCIVCHREGYEPTRAEIHHIRHNHIPGRLFGLCRRDHHNVIPLCPIHHRLGDAGTALHAGQRTWEEKYGTENFLFAEMLELIGESNG